MIYQIAECFLSFFSPLDTKFLTKIDTATPVQVGKKKLIYYKKSKTN